MWLKAYFAFLWHSIKYLHSNSRGFANITLDFEKWKYERETRATLPFGEPFDEYDYFVEEPKE